MLPWLVANIKIKKSTKTSEKTRTTIHSDIDRILKTFYGVCDTDKLVSEVSEIAVKI